MISWARAVLGQTQELPEPPVTVEDVLGVPKDSIPVFVPPRESRAPSLRSALLWVSLAAAAAGLFAAQSLHTRQLERERTAVRQQNDRLSSENQALARQVSALQAERNTLDERIFALGVQLAAATTDLQRANERLAASERVAAQLKEVEATLQEQVAVAGSAKKAQQAAEREAGQLKEEKAALTRSADRLRAQLILLERERRDLAAQLAVVQLTPHPGVNLVSSTQPPFTAASASGPDPAPAAGSVPVELLPVIVRKGAAQPVAAIRGHLVDVNDQHQFIIIDKGTMDGVHEGMMFDVLRGDAPVGLVTAVRVRPQLAACNVLRTASPQPLRVGDTAVQRTP